MENYGFIRVAAATPLVKVADVAFNLAQIKDLIGSAEKQGVALAVFPEMCICGYTCADLFGQGLLLSSCEQAVAQLCRDTAGLQVTVVVGTPVSVRGRLYNCAAVIRDGKLRGLVPKVFIPTYNEFYEARWFASGADFLSSGSGPDRTEYAGFDVEISPNQIFTIGQTAFAVEICEDLWSPLPPSTYHALAGADLIVNPSASNEVLGKHPYRKTLVAGQSSRTVCGYIYSSCGYGESTQDLVFAGSSLIYENGTLMAENERFRMEPSLVAADLDVEKLRALRRRENTFSAVSPDGRPASCYAATYVHTSLGPAVQTDFKNKLLRHIEPHPFVPGGDMAEINRRAQEITSIQVLGLATRLSHIGCKSAVVGISGGLDSTLALLVTALAFDALGWSRSRIIGVTMPGFGTTGRTHANAVDLMAALGVTAREISIVPAVKQHFSDIGHDPSVHDVTYENSQARERTQLLMDLANQEDGIVVGTGDLSELALGWATYNGDHMSMYGVNASIPKTLVKYLVRWAALNKFDTASAGSRPVKDILLDIVDTPISPELIPPSAQGDILQKTEDLVGPYELHDFFLYHFFRFGYAPSKLYFLACKAFCEQKNADDLFVGPEGRKEKYDRETILKWLKKYCWRFFSQQFKRSCLPDGPKVGSVSLSPRGDWRMPSDASASLWIRDLENL